MTRDVVALLQNRDRSLLPILADALQDAGCDNDKLLESLYCNDLSHLTAAVHFKGILIERPRRPANGDLPEVMRRALGIPR